MGTGWYRDQKTVDFPCRVERSFLQVNGTKGARPSFFVVPQSRLGTNYLEFDWVVPETELQPYEGKKSNFLISQGFFLSLDQISLPETP